MSNDFGNLGARNSVFLCRLEMVYERIISYTLTNKRRNRDQTAGTQIKFIGAAPYFAKEDIVVEFRKFRGEVAELVAPSCLYYFFCAIMLKVNMLNIVAKRIFHNRLLLIGADDLKTIMSCTNANFSAISRDSTK